MTRQNSLKLARTRRNDRLIAVAAESHNHSHIGVLGDLNSNLVHQIERFFVAYNKTKGKDFEILVRYGPERSTKLLKNGKKKFTRGPSLG